MKRDAKLGQRVEVCPDCGEMSDGVSRREFLRSVGMTAAAVGAVSTPLARLVAAPSVEKTQGKPAETYVKLLHDSLTADQRKVMHFPFDHEKRSMISNNWHIVDENVGAIGKLYKPD